jgi:hypothetical protein
LRRVLPREVVMKSTGSTACAVVFGLWALSSASATHAQEQFLLLDTTYTATSQNTEDSHYAAMPAAGIPGDWRSPTDYTQGKAYVELDILQKPSDASTLYNICFENDSGAACLPYGPAYTATGHTAWSANFSAFWNFDALDWTKGVTKVSLILKDMMENKKQGDADFYPYKAHVVISIVPQGAKYVMPASSGGAAGAAASAGSGGGGGRMAGGAGRRAAAGGGGMHEAGDGGRGGSASANAGRGGRAAGASGAGAGAADASARDAGAAGASSDAAITIPAANGGSGGAPASNARAGAASDAAGSPASVADQLEDTTGCTIARARTGAAPAIVLGWLALAATSLVRARRRRR